MGSVTGRTGERDERDMKGLSGPLASLSKGRVEEAPCDEPRSLTGASCITLQSEKGHLR